MEDYQEHLGHGAPSHLSPTAMVDVIHRDGQKFFASTVEFWSGVGYDSNKVRFTMGVDNWTWGSSPNAAYDIVFYRERTLET